jgi:hypothetical protein
LRDSYDATGLGTDLPGAIDKIINELVSRKIVSGD